MTKRKDGAHKRVVWSPALGRRVVAALGTGMRVEDLAKLAWAPSRAALARWMLAEPDFGAAVRGARAAASARAREEAAAKWSAGRVLAAEAGARRHHGATGRPRLYGADAEAQVLMRIAEGETMSAICAGPGMPSRTAVHHWRWSRPGFAAALEQARLAQADAMADAVVDIADDCEPGLVALQKARLRMEARRRCLRRRR